MRECWLKPNQRPFLAGIAAGGLLVIFAVAAMVWLIAAGRGTAATASGIFAVMLIVAIVLLVTQMRRPRLAYENGELLVFAGSRIPLRVPIDVVEVLFLGSGPALPRGGEEAGPRAANVVVRLAESARDWREREMRPEWGKWSEGYIVLSGAWCEPIGHERLNEINHRLAEVRRLRREAQAEPKQVTT